MARGLPLEGARAGERRALEFAIDGVVTCELNETVGSLRERVARSPFGFALVLGEDRVVLGRLPSAVLAGDSQAQAEQAMQPGPLTSRPNMAPAKLLARLRDRGLRTGILTDPEGRLMG